MDTSRLTRIDETSWQIDPSGAMRVPGIIYGDETLIRAMDDKVAEQTANVASLPGIVKGVYVMPDAHWGYGFPIGGVAAFDPDEGGVVSAGGVGFDVSCGVRTLLTGLTVPEVRRVQERLADALMSSIPAGVGSHSGITLQGREMDAMLRGGAAWAVEQGWGRTEDLQRIEERGRMEGPIPTACPSGPRSASAARWAPWVRATTTWRCRRWRPFTIRIRRPCSAWPRATWW